MTKGLKQNILKECELSGSQRFYPEKVGKLQLHPHLEVLYSLNMFPEWRATIPDNPGTAGWQLYLTFKSL